MCSADVVIYAKKIADLTIIVYDKQVEQEMTRKTVRPTVSLSEYDVAVMVQTLLKANKRVHGLSMPQEKKFREEYL